MFVNDTTKQLVGRGRCFVDRKDSAGASTGWRYIGNVVDVTFGLDVEEIKRYSSAEKTSPLANKVTIRRTPKLKFKMDEHSRANLALATLGSETTLTQSSGSVSDVQYAVPGTDVAIRVAHRKISSVVVDQPNGTPKSGTTDYEVDAETGLIYIKPTGTITAGNIFVNYSHAAIAGFPVTRAATEAKIECAFLFVGTPATGPILEANVWRSLISPEGSLSLIQGDEFAEFECSTEVISDVANHANDPYYIIVERDA